MVRDRLRMMAWVMARRPGDGRGPQTSIGYILGVMMECQCLWVLKASREIRMDALEVTKDPN
jgi:hypothetical protein